MSQTSVIRFRSPFFAHPSTHALMCEMMEALNDPTVAATLSAKLARMTAADAAAAAVGSNSATPAESGDEHRAMHPSLEQSLARSHRLDLLRTQMNKRVHTLLHRRRACSATCHSLRGRFIQVRRVCLCLL